MQRFIELYFGPVAWMCHFMFFAFCVRTHVAFHTNSFMQRKCIRLFSVFALKLIHKIDERNTWAWARFFLAHVRLPFWRGNRRLSMYWSQYDHLHWCMKFTSSIARQKKTNCKRCNAPFRMITIYLCVDIFSIQNSKLQIAVDCWWWKAMRSYCRMRNLKFDRLIWLVSVSFQVSIGSETPFWSLQP